MAAKSEAAVAVDRQQEAEDSFLLADTSGDGYVDEDELLVLCEQILGKQNRAVDRATLAQYLTTFREEPDTPLNLDFDAFVSVYNSFSAKMRS